VSRVLFVVPPLTGHVNPTISVARALAQRGHEVAWVAHPAKVAPLLPPRARVFALPEPFTPQDAERIAQRARTARGAAALRLLWEDFLVPLARAMVPGIEAAVTEFAPDLLVVDQQAIAGSLVARRRGLRWATTVTTPAGILDPLATMPAVKRWQTDLIAGLEREAGLVPSDAGELSPDLVVVFTTSALIGPIDRFPSHYRFVGPSISDRPEPAAFPFDRLRRPCVLISMGTVNTESSGRFHATAIAALGDAPVQVVLVAPGDPAAPANFVVRSYVPQLALLPHVDAVVCHAGHNTVCEALAHGVPLVVAPIKDDQPAIAEQVVAAGAGLRVRFGRLQAPELRDAVTRVLTEPVFRRAAARVRASFESAGGASAAAAALEAL